MSLEILEASPLTTVQDLGRFGYQRFGVPTVGAMDWLAMRAANALVGNVPEAAALEIGLSDAAFTTNEAALIAVTGLGFELQVNDQRQDLWAAIYIRKGWEIRIRKTGRGAWGYLGVSGGLTVEKVLGSQATYTRGKFGGVAGRCVQVGDVIMVGQAKVSPEQAGRYLPANLRPPYEEETIEVILGPQQDRFMDETVHLFLSAPYRISATSDRMGYRLEGAALTHRGSPDIISDGMVLGAIQVPANGQPILMMADHATAGGYPKIATVISADIPLVAQRLSIGATPKLPLQFKQTTVEAAQAKYRALLKNLRTGIVEPEDNFYFQ